MDQHTTPRTPNLIYRPFEDFRLEPAHPTEVEFGTHKLKLVHPGGFTTTAQMSEADALRLQLALADALTPSLSTAIEKAAEACAEELYRATGNEGTWEGADVNLKAYLRVEALPFAVAALRAIGAME